MLSKNEAKKLLDALAEKYKIDPLEEAELFVKLTPHYSHREIAEKINKSRSYVSQRLYLHRRLIPELKKLLREGKINFWKAFKLSTAPEQEQKLEYQKLLEAEKDDN